MIRVGPLPEPKASPGAPRTRNARRLSPPAGARLTTRRPELRWRVRAGARLYNVQLFLLEGATPRKVHSAFPASARYRVPRGVLSVGERYLWRAWPYMAGGYTAQPVGVSFFDVGRPVRLTGRQVLVTQRIAQAAVRRIAAVQRWLDAGLTTGDLRDGGLDRSDFTPAVALSGSGAAIVNGLATPRPLAQPPPAPARPGAAIAVTRRQLLINQRISQAALRRAVALERRLAGGLTGGDLREGAITASKLAPGLSVAGAGLEAAGRAGERDPRAAPGPPRRGRARPPLRRAAPGQPAHLPGRRAARQPAHGPGRGRPDRRAVPRGLDRRRGALRRAARDAPPSDVVNALIGGRVAPGRWA